MNVENRIEHVQGHEVVEPARTSKNRYKRLITSIFLEHFKPGVTEFRFTREDFRKYADELGFNVPSNIGDNIYNFRFGRADLPEEITKTAPRGKGWMIWLAGRGKYKFKLGPFPFFEPSRHAAVTKIPDATPGIIEMYALTDEQALLARIRYNRLIDIFTGVTCYSLQSHLRTTVEAVGPEKEHAKYQIETDEVYVGIDRRGAHYIFPVQAKAGKDKVSIVQVEQDFALCRKEEFQKMTAVPIAAHFDRGTNVIALFAFEKDGDWAKVLSEKHYKLVSPNALSAGELEMYRRRLMKEVGTLLQ